MSSKIDGVPRELAERVDDVLYIMTGEDSYQRLVQKYGTGWWGALTEMRAELRSVIAAPVVEHPPVDYEQWWADTPDGDSALVTRAARLTEIAENIKALCKHPSMSFHQVALLEGVLSDSAPPELAELQATIAQLRREQSNDLIAYKAAIEKQDELRSEIERLKAGQGEPVLFVAVESIEDLECVGMHATRKANELQHVPLYTSPPAPVSKQEAATLIASHLASGRSEGHVSEVARAIIALASTTDNLF